MYAVSVVTAGNPPAKSSKKPAKAAAKSEEANPLALQRRTVAISLLTSLAEEARSFQDQSLRARVQMRAADALWEADPEKGRALFRRAWEAADTADKEAFRRYTEERQRISSSTEPNRHLQSPPELRNEVMRLIAKRDRALAQEFLGQLTDDTVSDTANPAVNSASPVTARSGTTRRLASCSVYNSRTSLLNEGDVAQQQSSLPIALLDRGHNPRHLVPLHICEEKTRLLRSTFCVDAVERQ